MQITSKRHHVDRRMLPPIAASVVAGNALVYAVLFIAVPDGVSKLVDIQTRAFTSLPFSRTWNLLWIPLVVVVAEAPLLGWKRSSASRLLKGSLSARHDALTCLLRYSGILACVTAIFFFGLETVLAQAAKAVAGASVLPTIDNAVVGFLIWLVIIDLLGYAYHRMMHRVKFMWEWHKFHHAATEFNVITGARVHFLESGVKGILVAVPLVLLGAPVVTVAAVLTTKRVLDQLQHSMLPWTYGWVGRWLFYSPVGHRIHHSPEVAHWDKNFGDHLVVWDRLFGTWYPGTDVNASVGVSDNYLMTTGAVRAQFAVVSNVVQSFATSLRTNSWRMPPTSTDQTTR